MRVCLFQSKQQRILKTMKNQSTKKINRTFSIPVDLFNDLQSSMSRKEMNHFIAEAVRNELNARNGRARQGCLMDDEEDWLLQESKCWQDSD